MYRYNLVQYRLEAVQDTNGRCQQKKSWFHFRVTAPKNTRIRFSIENVNIYENMYEVCNMLLELGQKLGKTFCEG